LPSALWLDTAINSEGRSAAFQIKLHSKAGHPSDSFWFSEGQILPQMVSAFFRIPICLVTRLLPPWVGFVRPTLGWQRSLRQMVNVMQPLLPAGYEILLGQWASAANTSFDYLNGSLQLNCPSRPESGWKQKYLFLSFVLFSSHFSLFLYLQSSLFSSLNKILMF